jgi:hypothetical protein
VHLQSSTNTEEAIKVNMAFVAMLLKVGCQLNTTNADTAAVSGRLPSSQKSANKDTQFLQSFQGKYPNLEDTMQFIVPHHEKIGQQSACLQDYSDFAVLQNV